MINSINFDLKLEKFFFDIRCNNRIANIICSLDSLKRNGDFVEFVDSTSVSYIPKSKLESFNLNPDREKYQVNIKIGRFISRFIQPEIFKQYATPADLENFVNEYKSYFGCVDENLKIVSGSDISKYYLEDNYFCYGSGGTLWRSCMRQSSRNKFLKLYEDSQARMLILITDDGLIRSRALLWKAYDKDDNIYNIMDRIYTTYDHDVNFFKNWAQKNGYYSKYEQTAFNESLFVSPTGSPIDLELMIKLPVKNFKYYPYLDTFKFFDSINGILYNKHNRKTQYTLIQCDGSLEKSEEYVDENETNDADW